ncbi:GAF domain-containing protein [Candidatus Methylomirabilis sp.]|uniref:GAF domain-containing protein n=1 Tax=Candidatus Methylomirabilis sp. TaxID=2032687 RepID=UPI002A646EA9|nr:GAF domain-containing protein [Candidatus Methylomirabilis sp.]
MRSFSFRRFTLTSILISLFALASLIPLGAFGFTIIRIVSDDLVRRTLRELKQSVLHDAHQIQHRVDTAQGDLPVLNHVAAMRELIEARVLRDPVGVEQWRKALEQVFLAFSTNRKVYNQIRYIDEDGQEVVRVDYDGVKPPQAVPRDQLRNRRQRSFFPETMKLGPGEIFVSPLNLNREGDQIEVPYRPTIRYATPLFDDAGHRRGIVIINVNAGILLDVLHLEGTAAGKVVYAVDQDGFYLLHPDSAKRWGGPSDLNTGQRLQQDLPTLATQILSQQAVATILEGHVVTSQSITLSAGSPARSLVVVERMPTSIALAPVAGLRWYLLILLVGVGAVAVVGAVLVGGGLARPIVTLEKAAQQVQEGDLQVRVEVSGFHEIVALGEAFNAMTQGLAQSHGQIERQLAELQARQRVTDSTLCVPDLAERMRIALREILVLLRPTIKGALYLVERGRLVLKVEEGFSPTFLALGRDVPLAGCPWVGAPTETCVPWEGSDPITEALRQEGVMAWISLPLMVEEKLEGALLLANSRATLLEEHTSRTLRAMVDQVAVALHHARLYAESQERMARLITLREIDQAIAAQLPLEGVIKVVLERVHLHMKTDAVGLSLIDCEKKRTLFAYLRLPGGVDIQEEAFTLSESLLEVLCARQEPVLIYDLLDDPRVTYHREIIRRYDLKSYLAVPLVVQGTTIGVLHVLTTVPHRFEANEVDFFTTLAGQAAISIQNARMYEMSLRRGEALAALTHSTIALAESGPEPEAISTMLQGVNRATGASRSAWLAYDEAARRLHVGTSVGFPPEVLHQAEQALTISLTDPWIPARAAVEGRSIYLKQTGGSPFWPVFDPDVRSANCAPLTYRGRLYGVLVLLSEEEDGFGSEALSLADTFALYAGAALANGTLYREIQQAARELEAKVEDRTQQLQVVNTQLEAASRHKSAFLANMSHELRTPLNAILGFAELLRDETCGPLSAKQDRYLGHIHSSGKHLLALINDLLDLSKVEAGKLELRPETFVLYEALTVALEEVRFQAEAKQLQLGLQVDESLSIITADPVRFTQIILNLLSNAVKFTPEGGTVTVTARTGSRGEGLGPSEGSRPDLKPYTLYPGEFVEIAVQDTGVGIPAEDLPKLFQPFIQLESTLVKQRQGTGLGLALTKQLIELHGGSIWAASEGAGLGSTFTICLPLCHPSKESWIA